MGLTSPSADCIVQIPPEHNQTGTITIHDIEQDCCDATKKAVTEPSPPKCVVGKSFIELLSMNGGPTTGDACKVTNPPPAKAFKVSELDYYGVSTACCNFTNNPQPPVPDNCPPKKIGLKLEGTFVDGTASAEWHWIGAATSADFHLLVVV